MVARIWVLTVILAAVPAGGTRTAPPDTGAYDAILRQYVEADGMVRYGELREGIDPLDAFVQQISEVSPHSHPELFRSGGAKLAYWLNAYNALVLWAFASEYPVNKDRLSGLIGRGLFFYRRKFPVGGKRLSLAHIENKIIRAEFDDPRIHFALVCASASCPWLARKAYTAENLEEMLERETRRFLNQDRNVEADRERRVVRLSKLFDWYSEDFGTTPRERLGFVARYRDRPAPWKSGDWKIRYFEYDWSLNDAAEATR